MPEQARPFWLIRDDTVVADGVKFPDGTAVMRWRSRKPSTGIYDDLGSIVAIHGNGNTRAQWCDTAVEMTKEETEEETGYGFA